jgi:hypothetical protein
MQIKSDERVQGVIYKGIRYVRFPFFDPEFNEEFVQWWVRDPLDTLTRVRDRDHNTFKQLLCKLQYQTNSSKYCR